MHFFEKRALPPAVPIVPMIDILTILLIFFIVHSQWKKPRTLMEIDIPTVKNITGTQETKPRTTLSLGRNSQIQFNGTLIDQQKLAQALKEFKENNPDMQLEMEADKNVPLELLLSVWDTLTEVGIDIKSAPVRIEVESNTPTTL